MSIATEIARLQLAKADLKASINAKGGNITDETIDEYADFVDNLDTCIYLTQEEYDLLDTPNENITYIIVEVE
jgi:hypothetical protein